MEILRLIVTFFGIVLLSYVKSSDDYEGWKLVEVRNSRPNFETLMKNIEISEEIKLIDIRKGKAQLLVNSFINLARLQNALNKEGLKHEIVHNNISKLMQHPKKRKRSISSNAVDHYMSLYEMEEYFSYLESSFPKFIRRKIIGQSFEGRNISLFIISSNYLSAKPICDRRNQVGSENYRRRARKRREDMTFRRNPSEKLRKQRKIDYYPTPIRYVQSQNGIKSALEHSGSLGNVENFNLRNSGRDRILQTSRPIRNPLLVNYDKSSYFRAPPNEDIHSSRTITNINNLNYRTIPQQRENLQIVRSTEIPFLERNYIKNLNIFQKSRTGRKIPVNKPQRIDRNNKSKPTSSIVGNDFRIEGNSTHYFIHFNPDFIPKSQNIAKQEESYKSKSKKPIIFIDAGVHSREWISPAAALYFIQKLIENPELMEDVDWYIMPMVNPDGYEYSWTYNRFWRKTRSKSKSSPCAGVDINRNFDIRWKEEDTSENQCEEHYGGKAAASEIETKLIKKVIQDNRHRMKAYVSLHNWGQDILYPYTYTLKYEAPTADELLRVSKGMADSIKHSGGVVYKYGQGSKLLYPASGVSTDWAYEVAGIPYSFLVELRDSHGLAGFLLPEESIKPTGEDVFAAMKYLAKEVENKYSEKCN